MPNEPIGAVLDEYGVNSPGCSAIGNSIVENVTSSEVTLADPDNGYEYPDEIWDIHGRGGWIAWGSCDYALRDSPNIEDELLEQAVCALGIQFSDIKYLKVLQTKFKGLEFIMQKEPMKIEP